MNALRPQYRTSNRKISRKTEQHNQQLSSFYQEKIFQQKPFVLLLFVFFVFVVQKKNVKIFLSMGESKTFAKQSLNGHAILSRLKLKVFNRLFSIDINSTLYLLVYVYQSEILLIPFPQRMHTLLIPYIEMLF